MLVGWALAFGAAWEVIRDDDTIPSERKRIVQEDARAIARSLMTVQASGYDLEIMDADGRTTFHGYLNENAFERAYIPGVNNGFHAIMALGIVGALAYAADDPEIDRYLHEDLIETRKLARIAAEDMVVVNLGEGANFSNYNMAFTGALLAQAYVRDPEVKNDLRIALRDQLYDAPDSTRQPIEMKQSFYDFIYAAGMLETKGVDAAALTRGMETLAEFPSAPFWDLSRTNCDEAEISAGHCTLDDGTEIDLLGFNGRGDQLIADRPIPMRVRPPSNYFWRSNPYQPNGEGDGTNLLPAVDFRVAYWFGRWTKLPAAE